MAGPLPIVLAKFLFSLELSFHLPTNFLYLLGLLIPRNRVEQTPYLFAKFFILQELRHVFLENSG